MSVTRTITVASEPFDDSRAAIFAYEKGAEIPGAIPPPARRVGFFHYKGTEDLTAHGKDLFFAALEWLLEPTNEPYAIAKIAGIKLCESYNRQYGVDYRSVMPTNLYGPGDNFHPENSHVLPALIRRFHEAAQAGANEVVVWGSGRPMREFLHVDDMAEASLFVLDLPSLSLARARVPVRIPARKM